MVVNLIRRYGVLIAIVAVVGVIAVVGMAFRDRFGSNPGELVVGDCFDEPGGVGLTVENVQHHPDGRERPAPSLHGGTHD